jgi:hypothetical protein
MGIVAVAPEKIAHAVHLLGNILAGTTITFNQYRSFIGLLEHMLLFVGGDITFMYHLYGRNFHAGLIFGPLTRMIFLLQGTLQPCVGCLKSCSCVLEASIWTKLPCWTYLWTLDSYDFYSKAPCSLASVVSSLAHACWKLLLSSL